MVSKTQRKKKKRKAKAKAQRRRSGGRSVVSSDTGAFNIYG